MYCPSCGRQQANNQVRFCFSCGFQLGGVTDLLNNQGVPPYQAQQQLPPMVIPPVSPRRKGMKNGAKLMFLSAVLTPIFIGISATADEGAPMVVPFTIFLAGLCWLVYSAIFGEDYVIPQAPKTAQPLAVKPPMFNANPPRSALPTADNYQVTMPPPQRINTSEIVNPPSVTEHTTHLLEKE